MNFIRIFFSFILICGLICPQEISSSSHPQTLAPKGRAYVYEEWASFFSMGKTPQQLAEHLTALAPNLKNKGDLETIANQLGQLSPDFMKDEQKIDLLETILKLSPGNPLNKKEYKFIRNNFFIPLILKEETIQLKLYAEKKGLKELTLLDIGSGNGAVLWLLRQLLRSVGISQHKIIVVERFKERLDKNKKINNDLNEKFFLEEELLSFDWLTSYQNKAKKDLSFPLLFDAIIFQHTLHEIYSTLFQKRKSPTEAKEAIKTVLAIAHQLMNSEAILHIHDGILPKNPDEKITFTFQRSKKDQLEKIWLEFLQKKNEIGLNEEWVHPQGNYSYEVSKRLLTHFITKLWYLVYAEENPNTKPFSNFELSQIANFATFDEMVELIQDNGFTPFFSLKLKEQPFLEFIQENIEATTKTREPFLPWQFTGFLATHTNKEAKQHFTPTHETYDGPIQSWFDSFEYRQGRKKLESEMYEGLQSLFNNAAAGRVLSFIYDILWDQTNKKYFTPELIQKMELFESMALEFGKSQIILQQKESRAPLSISERLSYTESNLFWKYELMLLANEIVDFIEKNQEVALKQNWNLDMLKEILDLLNDFKLYFTKEPGLNLDNWTHKKFFEWTAGKGQDEGWMRKHVHFHTDKKFTSAWNIDQDKLPFEIEIFRTLLYLLYFIGRDNSIPDEKVLAFSNLPSPFHIEVRKEGHRLIIELQFHIHKSRIDNIFKQEKVLFAQKVASYLNGDFVVSLRRNKAKIYFEFPHFKFENEDKKLPTFYEFPFSVETSL